MCGLWVMVEPRAGELARGEPGEEASRGLGAEPGQWWAEGQVQLLVERHSPTPSPTQSLPGVCTTARTEAGVAGAYACAELTTPVVCGHGWSAEGPPQPPGGRLLSNTRGSQA